MQFVGSFDPSSTTSGQMDIGTVDPGSKVLLYNLSIVSILLNFEDGTTDILHAGEAKWWPLSSPTPTLPWKQYAVLNATPGPVSMVTITTYALDEEIVGTYPMSLIYILNLGNSVPLSTSATSIVNTGNAAGTNIVAAQVSGDGNNAVVLTNDAHLTLGDGLHPGLLNVDTASCGVVNAGTVNCANANISNVIASVHVDSPIVNTTTANVGTVNCTTENVQTVTINTVLNLLKGSLTRVGKGTGINTQTITHNWGVQADIVIPYYNGAFGTPPTQALAVFSETANSFQVAGQTGYSWTVLYIKF